MTNIRQPDFGPEIFALLPPEIRRQVLDLAEFQTEESAEADKAAERQKRIDAQARYYEESEEGRRRAQMKLEEAKLSGTLAPEAEMFRDLKLKPRVREAHDFEVSVRTPIVQNLFFRNSLTWVAGTSGTFKSFVTADLAFRYGTEDLDYHGKRMTHGRALLIVAEGAAAYADRKTAWEKQHDRQVKNVSIYPAPLQLGDTLKEMPALISYLKEEAEAGREFGLIVFDTQAMCTVGVEENGSEMNLVINILHQLREVSGACIMVVHHFGKQKSAGMRGSSMIYAAADTVCVLKREDDAMSVKLSTAQVDEGKQKDAIAEKDLLTLEMVSHAVGEDFFGDTVFSLAPQAVEGGSVDILADADIPTELPSISEVDLYYLRGIGTYELDGGSPSALGERLQSDDYVDRIIRPAHKSNRQTASNRLQGLKKKGLTEPVPGAKGRWRITPLGNSVVAQHMIDRIRTEADWSDRNARRGRFRGPNTSGSELGSPPLLNHDGEPNEPE